MKQKHVQAKKQYEKERAAARERRRTLAALALFIWMGGRHRR